MLAKRRLYNYDVAKKNLSVAEIFVRETGSSIYDVEWFQS